MFDREAFLKKHAEMRAERDKLSKEFSSMRSRIDELNGRLAVSDAVAEDLSDKFDTAIYHMKCLEQAMALYKVYGSCHTEDLPLLTQQLYISMCDVLRDVTGFNCCNRCECTDARCRMVVANPLTGRTSYIDVYTYEHDRRMNGTGGGPV